MTGVATLARRIDHEYHATFVLAERLLLAAGQWLNGVIEHVRTGERGRRPKDGDSNKENINQGFHVLDNIILMS